MFLDYAKEVFKIESEAVASLIDQLDDNFEKCISAILESKGRLVVCGIGKSGLIGKKIAATLASTGTPSFFMHPSEAFHGDLGMLTQEDIILMISNSGETSEILQLIPYLRSKNAKILSITGNPDSSLAKNSSFHLKATIDKEACPLNLAPTASTTVALAMGDAVAIALMQAKNFKPEDFAQFHPGGSLGRKLLTKVRDVMYNEVPMTNPEASLIDIINKMSTGKLGLVLVADGGQIKGIITDGDLRRLLEKENAGAFEMRASNFMTECPKTISPDALISKAENIMIKSKVSALIVAESNEVIGIVDLFSVS